MKSKVVTLSTLLMFVGAFDASAETTAPDGAVETAGETSGDDARVASSAEARLAAALERKVERSNSLREEPVASVPTTGSDQRASIFRWSFGAGGFAVLLLAGAVWLKRTREARLVSGTGVGLSIQESVWVGKGQRLLVVNAAGQRYLLGATGAGLETLAELGPASGDEPAEAQAEAEAEPPAPATFKDLVSQAMTSDGAPRRRRREILDGLRAL